jgi:predicted Co/Zn/Cd cation transporter (cation efflux family)
MAGSMRPPSRTLSGVSDDATAIVTQAASGPAPASAAGRERHGLLVSIVVTAALGALGVAWGLLSGSQMILLDGIYAVIGIATSWLLLRASALAAAGPTRSYPFGREAVTPLVIGIQGTILVATLLYAAAEAVFTILRGGSAVTAGSAILYSVLITAASLVVWRWLQRGAGASDLLVAEATAWRIAALRGVGMVVGFTVLLAIQGSSLDRFAPYVDPVMVLVTCLVFLPPPIRMIRTTIVELLEGSPPARVSEPVHAALDRVTAAFELRDVAIRMTKVGPKLYLEVEATARPDVTIGQVDGLRADIERSLAHLPYDLWLNLELRPPAAQG